MEPLRLSHATKPGDYQIRRTVPAMILYQRFPEHLSPSGMVGLTPWTENFYGLKLSELAEADGFRDKS